MKRFAGLNYGYLSYWITGWKKMGLNKKKILVLVDWFAPGYKAGGPIQSCVNFAFALKNDFDIYVLTTDTDHGENLPYPDIVSGEWIKDPTGGFHIYYAKKKGLGRREIKNVILSVNADFIYLNHLFSPFFVVYPLWLKYAGKLDAKVVLCPRGALYQSALSVKPYKKKPFISLFRLLGMGRKILFHATNDREENAIRQFFPGSKIIIADNLPETNQRPFQSCEKKAGHLKAIFIARIVAIKNLLFLLEALKKISEEVELTIIGPVEDKSYWKECEKKIAELPANLKINYIGPRRNNELAEILKQHHLFILPTTGENFGHSIFEALLCGRPVLISDQTPWLGLSAKKAGWDLSLSDVDKFTEVIRETAGWDQDSFDEWAMGAWQYANAFINNPEIHTQYLQLFS
jgi:glycosyltransferase involved in cell wall biosynthesis